MGVVGDKNKMSGTAAKGVYEHVDRAAVSVATPEAVGTPCVEVVAPANLPEGFKFEAEIDGGERVITVTVPVGGVEEGQKFFVPLEFVAQAERVEIPVGHWRDGLCACFTYGCCHPVVWNSYCCPVIALAQVMQRMGLTWYASPGSAAATAGTCRTIGIAFAAFILSETILYFFMMGSMASMDMNTDYSNPYQQQQPGAFFMVVYYLQSIIRILFALYILIAMCKTRKYIRSKYAIPAGCCGEACDDCCCVYWCTCCTVAQMSRHTADYSTYRGTCCTETGLPNHVPSIV